LQPRTGGRPVRLQAIFAVKRVSFFTPTVQQNRIDVVNKYIVIELKKIQTPALLVLKR
jgi:septum formation topological specificity factor MinE